MQHTHTKSLAIASAVVGLLGAPGALADAGHDHGAKAAPTTAGSASPRFSATSELFELVGVVDGQRLTLYLDRSADNSPVQGARLEIELGGSKIAVKPLADGGFEAMLAQPLKAGVTPVTATVTAGQETDLLAGEIEIPPAAQDAKEAARTGWLVAAWVAVGVLTVTALAGLARWAAARRGARRGAAA